MQEENVLNSTVKFTVELLNTNSVIFDNTKFVKTFEK